LLRGLSYGQEFKHQPQGLVVLNNSLSTPNALSLCFGWMDRQSRRHERLQNRADAYSGLHLGASLRFEKSHRMAFPDKEQELNLSYLFGRYCHGPALSTNAARALQGFPPSRKRMKLYCATHICVRASVGGLTNRRCQGKLIGGS
jgi:hypothetical protein